VDATVSLGAEVDRLYDLIDNRGQSGAKDGKKRFTFEPYGYYWLRQDEGPESLAGRE
jgi:hypothetical protein